jgi:hypothetical protein
VISQRSAQGNFRPINDVGAMSAFHPIATKLLHYGKRRYGPIQLTLRAVPTYASCRKENFPPSSIAVSEKLAVSEVIILMAA